MNQEELDIELIERYFRGSLTAEELADITHRMRTDDDFAEKVDDYKAIFDGLQRTGYEQFSADVAGWERELSARKEIEWKRYLAVAATVLLFAVAGYYFLNDSQPASDSQQLYAEYFQPYEDVLSVRNGDTDENALGTAMTFYNQQRYDEAIPYFQKALTLQPENTDALFYLAIAQLANDNPAVALESFRAIAASNNVYHDQAEWYMALCYLKANDPAKAKGILASIIKNSNHSFYTQAKELSNKLA